MVFVGLLASQLGVRAEMTGLEESRQLSSTADMEKLDTGGLGQGWTLTPPIPQSCSFLILIVHP